MGGRFKYWFIGVIVLLLTLNYAFAQEMDASTRAYLDSQNQKTVSQINAKIDQTANRLEKDLEKEVVEIEARVEEKLQNIIKRTVKAIAIGISGIIIITLAVFKVIDLKLTSTKKLQKYEDMLKRQNNELKIIISENQRYRESLKRWHGQLKKYQDNLQKTGVTNTLTTTQSDVILPEKQNVTPVAIPKQEKKKIKITWKTVAVGLVLGLVLGGAVYFIILLVNSV